MFKKIYRKSVMQKPFVSVIIPIYCVEPYLHRCIDSVINQTLREIEIICVNDASPDNADKILEKYAKNDSRIKIITFEQNRGVAIARNIAIKQAKGEYIGFVDGDDYVDLDFFEKLYIHAKNTDAEVVKAQINQISIDGSVKKCDVDINLSNKTVFAELFVVAIYKKTLIEKFKIKFFEGLIFGEDRLFPISASFLANKTETVHNTFYNYIRRKNSADSNSLNSKQLEDFFCSTKQIIEFINKNVCIEKDYIVLMRRFITIEIGLLAKVEHKNNMELAVNEILGINNFIKEAYKQSVFDDLEIKLMINYLKNNTIENIVNNRKTIRKTVVVEYFKNNLKKSINR